ncbi:GNAT family N-acetyltransferase [Jiella marina]|uniref:GNAT family N-acetyltransferase n=1 Tax=Jiella sp. LLJ827 TaxID=2917712 RepID=UPI0021019037|nr:GNAT family N-acetyltransferase [Jiella sp. LLJ827]MCQ0990164.1 GNAT family N-acetyltransferase [Jiella sp. LLJ827]
MLGADSSILAIDLDDRETMAPLLALNNAHAAELSLLDETGFHLLVGAARLALRSADSTAFVLALDQTATTYDSPNYHWFRDRYERFLYVDRIVVAPAARGRGLARRLYDAVFMGADQSAIPRVVCEVNIQPPNPASERFHEALGFRVVGEATIHGGQKTVRYYERPVPGAPQ